MRKSHEAGSVYAAYCLYTRQQASSFITLYNHKKRGLRKIEAFHLCQIIENMQIDAHEIWDYKPYDMYLHKILKQPNNLEHISLPPRFSWRGCCRRRWYVVLQSAHCAHLNVVDTCKITKRRAQHSGNSELLFFNFSKIACHIFSKTIVVNNCYSYIYTLNSPTVVNSPLYMPLSPYNRCLNYQAMRLS